MAKKAKTLVVLTSQREMIEKLGGPSVAASLLLGSEDKRPTVSMWLSRGSIAARHRLALKRQLNLIGFDVTTDFLTPTHGNTKMAAGVDIAEADLAFAPGLTTQE